MSNSNPRGWLVTGTSVFFFVLATISVSMRLWARFNVLKNAGLDELAIVASYVCSVFLLAMTEEQVKHGLGKHMEVVSPTDFEDMLRYLWISISFYNASLCLTKASIVLQYLRVFPAKEIRRACWATLAVIGVHGVYAMISNILSCIPVSAFWSPTADMRCIDKKFLWFFNASFNILSDLVILILPMPIIKSLKLPIRQKVGLMMVLGLGGFVCLVSILRLQSLYVISVSQDPTFQVDNTGASIWSNIEVYTGIICASLPAIKPIVARVFPRLLSSTRNGKATATFGDRGLENNNTFNGTPNQLAEVEMRPKTVTKVEANEGRGHNMRRNSSGSDLCKDIIVTMSMRQDVENRSIRSDADSGKDLIIQVN